MTKRENRNTSMMKVMTPNIANAAKSLREIRMWIAIWSAIAIIGFIVYTLLAITRV